MGLLWNLSIYIIIIYIIRHAISHFRLIFWDRVLASFINSKTIHQLLSEKTREGLSKMVHTVQIFTADYRMYSLQARPTMILYSLEFFSDSVTAGLGDGVMGVSGHLCTKATTSYTVKPHINLVVFVDGFVAS